MDDTVFPGGSSDGGITVEMLQLSSTMSDGFGSVDVFFARDLVHGTVSLREIIQNIILTPNKEPNMLIY